MPSRSLPSSPEAENALLGTMLMYDNASRAAIEEGLSEDDFYDERNRLVFKAALSLYRMATPIDLASVSTYLKDEGNLEKAGGLSYLAGLNEAAVTSANTLVYVKILRDKSLLRKMIETGETITANGLSGQTDVNAYLDECEKAVMDVSRDRRTTAFQETPELMNKVIENIHKMADNKSDVTGVKTGFRDLDRLTHGFQPGDLIILAARPSMGKTAVALNLVMNVAAYQPDKAVALFSLEMSAESLAMRLLSAKSRVEGDKLKTGRLNANDEWNLVNEASMALKKSKIFIDDTPGTKVTEIFSKCRRLQAEEGLSMVVIDYIQLISGNNSGRGEINRQQEVSEISRNLKALARELKVPVIALSQLSRNVESREDKKPQLSDLRESGAIEQDADIVMLLFRKAYYSQEAKDEAEKTGSEELEINVAKHRNGATRRIYLAFEAATNALMSIERHAEQS